MFCLSLLIQSNSHSAVTLFPNQQIMSTLCIQVQTNRLPGIDIQRVQALSKTIASNKKLVTRFAVVEGQDDGPYSNLMFETLELQKLWESLWETLYRDGRVGSALSQASMAMCEGSDGWNNYLLLYHLDPLVKLDRLDAS
jgi:hypothetical protein